jgi:hypothetical protein
MICGVAVLLGFSWDGINNNQRFNGDVTNKPKTARKFGNRIICEDLCKQPFYGDILGKSSQ